MPKNKNIDYTVHRNMEKRIKKVNYFKIHCNQIKQIKPFTAAFNLTVFGFLYSGEVKAPGILNTEKL